ncbi:MAG TPA: ankyrin repeat domain-containing protein [Candidatus Ignatzschineria merdigallinarum]|uniref:Ankyrin repeat domain-containing protein n=1 Tax=Candidatus Ignatzschineria merdigallinarum TaxID=2838621 RepID=A0A9D1TTT0_9GAMM|nr:ankyrin repeat domain-containing protein [Candidatus Ignatzschineria merdigallinarum]
MAEVKDTATALPWIRYDQNPYGVPLLDLRPITFQLGSEIEDAQLKNLDSYSMEDGASFSGLSVETENGRDRLVDCELTYQTAGKLYPGSLFVPQSPEDRWAIFFDGAFIYFIRSWSKELVAKAAVQVEENEIKLTQIEGAILDDGFETENQTIALVNFIMCSYVLNETVPVPLSNELESEPNRAAVWAFSLFGHHAKVGVFNEDALFGAKGVIRSTTAYHIAIANNDVETVKLILNQNLVEKDLLAQDGFTPVHWALYTDNFEMMKALHEQGVNINARSLLQTTPLMDAVELKSAKGIEMLLSLEADVHAVDVQGFSALHRAASMGQTDIVVTLLMQGADPFLASVKGFTALDLAKERNHEAIIALFTEKD